MSDPACAAVPSNFCKNFIQPTEHKKRGSCIENIVTRLFNFSAGLFLLFGFRSCPDRRAEDGLARFFGGARLPGPVGRAILVSECRKQQPRDG